MRWCGGAAISPFCFLSIACRWHYDGSFAILIGLIIAAFAVFLMITGMRLAISQSNQLVPALGITYLYVYLAMPIGAFFILVFAGR